MTLVAVRCNHCGASLRISETTRFVTCDHCRSQLAVQRTDTAIFTEAIKAIDQKTSQIAADLEAMRLQKQIETLDREWESKRAVLLAGVSMGSNGEPSEIRAKVWMILFATPGVVLMVCSLGMVISTLEVKGLHFSSFQGLFLALLGLLPIIAGVLIGRWNATMADQFQSQRARYAKERQHLVGQLSAAEKQGQR
jgi:ABC-type phosphate transport system auxiliary subunit